LTIRFTTNRGAQKVTPCTRDYVATNGWLYDELNEEFVTKRPRGAQEEEEAVTPCTRDYVATNGWLSKGRNRLTSGTARNPCFKRLKTHAQRALNAKNGRNRNKRDERATPAELPPSAHKLKKPCPKKKKRVRYKVSKKKKKRVRYKETPRGPPAQKKRKRVRYKETPRGPANPMFAPGPNPCPALVTQSATNLL
jgi:hypothetical protein